MTDMRIVEKLLVSMLEKFDSMTAVILSVCETFDHEISKNSTIFEQFY